MTNTTTQTASLALLNSEIEGIHRMLSRYEASYIKARQELADHVVKHGPISAIRWSAEAMQAEMKAYAAREVLKLIENGEPLSKIADYCQDEAMKQLSYTIVTCQDNVREHVYKGQAYAEIGKELASTIRYIERQQAKAA